MSKYDIAAEEFNNNSKTLDYTPKGKYDLAPEELSPSNVVQPDSRFNPSKYDDSYVPAEGNIPTYRSINQPWNHQASRAILGGAMSGLATFAESSSYIFDLDNNIKRLQGVEDVEDNVIARKAKEFKNGVNNEWLPIYRRNPNQIFDWGDSGFYWEALRGIVDSAVGFGLTGLTAAGAVRGTVSLAGKALRATRLSAYLNKIPEVTEAMQTFGSAYVTNFGEGKMMALELYDNAKKELMNQGYSNQEASKLAGEQADKFMLQNKAMIISDAFAMAGIAKTLGRGRNLLQERNLKTFAGSFTKLSSKNPVAQAGAEALEEIYQNTIQQEGEYQAKLNTKAADLSVPTSLPERLLSFATSDKSLMEGMMGFFGGPVQYGIIQHPFTVADREAYKERYQRQQEQIDENTVFMQKDFTDLIKKEEAKDIAQAKGELNLVEQIDEESFTDLVVRNYEKGTLDNLDRQIDDLILEENGEEKYGEGYQDKMTSYKDKIKNVEEDFQKLERKYPNPIYQSFIPQIYKLQKRKEIVEKQYAEKAIEANSLQEKVIALINENVDNELAAGVPQLEFLSQRKIALQRSLDLITSEKEAKEVRNRGIQEAQKLGLEDERKITPTNKLTTLVKDINKKIKDTTKEADKLRKHLEEQNEFQTVSIENSPLGQELKKALEEVTTLELQKLDIDNDLNEITDIDRLKDNLEKYKEKIAEKVEQEAKKAKEEKSTAKRAKSKKENKINNPVRSQEVTDSPIDQGIILPPKSTINQQFDPNDAPSDEELYNLKEQGLIEGNKKDKKQIDPDEQNDKTVYTDLIDKEVRNSTENLTDDLVKRNIVGNDPTSEEGDIESTKLKWAHNSLAYVSKDAIKTKQLKNGKYITTYEEKNNKISEELRDKNILSPNNYLVGTKVTLIVDEDYNNGTDTYYTLEQKGIDAGNENDYIPIAILNENNKIIGYLHDVEYPNDHTIEKNIEEDIKNIRKIRNNLIAKGKRFETTITEKTIGHIAINKDGAVPLTEATEDTNPTIILSTGKGILSNKGLIKKPLQVREGIPYILTKGNNGEDLALPLRSTNLKEEHKKSILNAFRAYLSGTKVEGVDLLSRNGILDYLRTFTNDTIPTEEFDRKLEKYMANQSNVIGGINITQNGAIDIAIGSSMAHISTRLDNKDKRIYTTSIPGVIASESTFFKTLDRILDLSYYHVNSGLLSENKEFKPLLIQDDLTTKVEEYSNYVDFLRENYISNVLGFDLGDNTFVYTVQPRITLDLKGLMESDINVEIERGEDIKNDKNLIVDEETGIVLNISKKTSLSTKPEQESNLDASLIEDLETRYNKINLVGPTALQQSHLVDSLSSALVKRLIKDKKINLEENLSTIYDFLHRAKSIYEQNDRDTIVERVDNLILQWDKLKDLIIRRVQKINGIKIFNDYGDQEGYNEKTNFNTSTMELDSRDTASIRLRHFLSTIYDTDVEGYISTTDTYINVGRFLDYDVIFSDLKMMLTYQEPSFKILMNILEANIDKKPYLKNVIQKLNEATTEVKNEFVSQMMGTHPSQFKTVQIITTKTDNGELTEARIINTNRSSTATILIEEWESNLINSNTVGINNEGHYIADALGKVLAKEFDELPVPKKWETLEDTEKDDIFNKYKKWLGKIGIIINDKFLTNIVSNYSFLVNSRKQSSGMLGVLAKNLATRGNSTFENNPLISQTEVKRLAASESFYRKDLHSTSFINGEKKTISTYNLNKYFTDRVRRLKNNDKNVRDNLKKTAYSKNSKWLELFDDANSNMNDVFDYIYLDTLQLPGDKRKKTLNDLNDTDLEILKLALFTNKGRTVKRKNGKDSERIINTVHLTTSNKSVVVGLTTIGHETSIDEYGEISSSTIDALFNALVLPEIQRINEFQYKKTNIEGFNEGSKRFLILPELQDEKFDFLREGKYLKSVNTLVEEGAYDKIKEYIAKEYIPKLVSKRIENWNRYNIIEGKKLNSTDNKYISYASAKLPSKYDNNDLAKYIATDFEVNYLLSNVNQTQLFTGDPAFFFKGTNDTSIEKNSIESIRTYNNMGKRLAREIAPGTPLANSWGKLYKVGLVTDTEVASLNKELLKVSKNYGRISAADAQELTTVEEHLTVLNGLGRITDEKLTEYSRKAKSKTLTDEDLDIVLQPLKPVYADNIYDEALNLERVIYIKSSSFPLIPQLTASLELNKLRIAMENQGIDRVAFNTAVKVGNTETTLDVFNSDGTVKDDIIFGSGNTLTLDRKGFRIQQDIPYDPNKTEIVDGTQQMKLLFDSILHIEGMDKLEQSFRDNYKEWYDIRRNYVKQLFTDSDGKVNMAKVIKLLKKEAISRGYSINDIELLNLTNQEFKKYIFFTESSSRFESLLNSIVDNKARKTKMPGFSGVLGTEQGFRFKEILSKGEDVTEYIRKNKSKIKFTKNWTGQLLGQRVENGIVKPGQVLAPWKIKVNGESLSIKDYINSDGLVDTTKLPEELLRMFGYRIPTSKHSSMTYVEIVGFLPENNADLVIMSKDLITQMGQDFDIDKIYFFNYNLSKDKETGKLQKYIEGSENTEIDEDNENLTEFGKTLMNSIKSKDINNVELKSKIKKIQNNILDIHFDVMSNKEVFENYIVNPITYGKLPAISEKLIKIRKKADDIFAPMSENYQKEKFLNARGGNQGIGVFSQLSTFMAKAQDKKGENKKNLYFTLGKKVYSTNFGDKKSVKISNSQEGKKTETISIFQNVSVDDENLQVLANINVNNYTFKVINSLLAMGFDEDTIVSFINQDSIKNYIYLVDSYKNSIASKGLNPKERALKRLREIYVSEKYTKSKLEDRKTYADTFGAEELYNMIGKGKQPEFTYAQLVLLDKFLELEKLGASLSTVMNATNVDSSGIGKSLIHSNMVEEEIRDLGENSHIANAQRLIYDEDFNINTISGFASETLSLNNELWNQIFPYRQQSLEKAFKEVSTILDTEQMSITQKSELFYNISQRFKSYIYSTISKNIVADRARLFINSKNNKSLASILKLMKEDLNINSNPLISRLKYKIDKRPNKISKISYDNTDSNNVVEDTLHAGFIELFKNNTIINGTDNYRVSDFARDLALYDFISGGVQEAIQFSKFIPVHYKIARYKDILNSINLDDEKILGTHENNISDFTKQWAQHNAWRFQKIAKEDLVDAGKNSLKHGSFTISEESKFAIVDGQGELNFTLPKYLTYDNNGTLELYEKIEDLPSYQRINRLGIFGMDEYQINSEDAVSIINENNTKKINVVSKKKEPSGEIKTNYPLVNSATAIGFGNNRSITNVLENISRNENLTYSRKLAEFYLRFKDRFNDITTHILDFNDLVGLTNNEKLQVQLPRANAAYTNLRTNSDKYEILINSKELSNLGDNLEKVVLHEVTHSLIDSIVDSGKDLETLDKLFKEYKAKGDPNLTKYTPTLKEFIAQIMSDKDTQADAAKLLSKVDGETKNILQKIFDEFKRLIANILEFDIDTNSILSRSMNEVMSLIENNNLDREVATEATPPWDIDPDDSTAPSNVGSLSTQNFNEVKYLLKSVEILSTDKAEQVFSKGKKNGWDLNKILTELQIPKEQKQIILDKGTNNREEIVTSLLADNSYTIEINTAKSTKDISNINFNDPDQYEEALENKGESGLGNNTQYYSNLTVPGGTNYTENEIAVPAITPLIKGHARFSTDKGIGWFRSDEKTINEKIIQLPKDNWEPKRQFNTTKTRRILEIQSDLFQKGRDRKDLITQKNEENISIPGLLEETFERNNNTYRSKIESVFYLDENQYDYDLRFYKNGNRITEGEFSAAKTENGGITYTVDLLKLKDDFDKNQFLQLLNKNNNWVRFFIQSIVQDSAKKGYEKVLFPTGDTASKIEGHSTLEEYKKQKEDRIKELEKSKQQEKYNITDDYGQTHTVKTDLEKINNEINQLKQELERIEGPEGFGALKPIWNFYENVITNTLQKIYGKENVKLITDEFSNSFNEIIVKKEYSNINISLDTQRKQKIDTYDVLIEDRKLRIKNLEEAITNLKHLGNAQKRIELLRGKVETIQQEIEEIKESTSLLDIQKFGKTDIESLRRIVSKKDVTVDEIKEGRRIINLWTRGIELLFLDIEKQTRNPIYKAFEDFANDAKHLEAVAFNKLERDFLASFLKGAGVDIDIIEEMKKTKDIDSLYAQVMDLTRTNNPMLQAIGKYSMIQNAKARALGVEKISKFDELLKKALPKLKEIKGNNKGSIFDIFKQKDKDGNATGKMVFPYKPEFFEERSKLFYGALNNLSGYSWNNFYKWIGENTKVFDTRIFYPVSEVFEGEDIKYNKTNVSFDPNSKEALQHKQDLENLLGKNEYSRMSEKLKNKINLYKERYENNKLLIWEEIGGDQQELRDQKLKEWVQTNSPYWHSEGWSSKKQVTDKGIKNKYGYEYTYEVASKEEWYDKSFQQIENDKDLFELYDYMLDILKEVRDFLPEYKKDQTSVNSIPSMNKTIAELFNTDSAQSGFSGIYDAVIKASVDSTISLNDKVDPVTGQKIRELNSGLNYDNEEINKLVDLLEIEFLQKEGVEPDKQQKIKIRKQATNQIVSEKSFDLEKIIKVMIVKSLAYRHKSSIEEPLRIAKFIVDTSQETRWNSDGKPIMRETKDGKSEEDTKTVDESFKNISTQLEAFINAFYGSRKKETIKSSKVIYTKKEKERIDKIDELLKTNDEQLENKEISSEKHTEISTKLTTERSKLGGVATGSQFLRNAMKAMQIKGMGWNIIGGFNNLGFGTISNYIEAGANQYFNTRELSESYGLVLANSVLKNMSINSINTKVAKKIRALMDKKDILSDATQELQRSMNRSKMGESMGRLSPLSIYKYTEYINQAVLMIAIMKHDGVWDKYNEDGEWIGEEKEVDEFALKIKQVRDRLHGNYNPDKPLALREKAGLQALAQFRTWMFESFAGRFESEKPDQLTGKVVKGRYRNGVFMINYTTPKEGVEMNLLETNLFTLKQLARKLVGFNTKFDDRFNEVDAANLRRNLTETVILMGMMMVGAMLKYAIKDEDDDTKRAVFYTLLNSMTRIQSDITLYTSPMDLESILKRPVPVSALVVDTYEWFNAIGKYMLDDDEIEGGIYDNHSRLLRETAQMFPGTTKIYQTYSTGQILY